MDISAYICILKHSSILSPSWFVAQMTVHRLKQAVSGLRLLNIDCYGALVAVW